VVAGWAEAVHLTVPPGEHTVVLRSHHGRRYYKKDFGRVSVPAGRDTVLVLTTVEPDPEAKWDEPRNSDSKPSSMPTTPKDERPVIATVSLTPPTGGFIVLADHRISLNTGTDDSTLREKWSKQGSILVLTKPTTVDLIAREKDVCRLRLDGKDWLVQQRWVPSSK